MVKMSCTWIISINEMTRFVFYFYYHKELTDLERLLIEKENTNFEIQENNGI